MEIKKAVLADIPAIMTMYDDARMYMRAEGNAEQWSGGYPSEELIKNDIESGYLHLCTDGDEILGVFFYKIGEDPTYNEIFGGSWLNGEDYGVLHRIAVSKNSHRRNVASFCFDYCLSQCSNLKVDTHRDNIPMQKALAKNGFKYCGIIHLENGDERLAYQKKRYETVLFDLDGTITDPGEGITNSVEYSLNKYGITVADRSVLYKFIGPPLYDSYAKYYGFSAEESRKAVDVYREYYRDRGIYECKLYDGITELLAALKAAGKKLVVATSKPQPFAVKVLQHFDVLKYFDYVAGATMDGKIVEKSDVIAIALRGADVKDVNNVVMVGDREYDVKGAAEFGIKTVGVLFGYGSREEFESSGAAYIAETAADIAKFIM